MLAVAVGTGIGGAIITGGNSTWAHTSRPVTSDTCHIRSPRDLRVRAAPADTSNPSRPAPDRSATTEGQGAAEGALGARRLAKALLSVWCGSWRLNADRELRDPEASRDFRFGNGRRNLVARTN